MNYNINSCLRQDDEEHYTWDCMYSKLTYHRQKKWRIQEGHGLGHVFMFAKYYIYMYMCESWMLLYKIYKSCM